MNILERFYFLCRLCHAETENEDCSFFDSTVCQWCAADVPRSPYD